MRRTPARPQAVGGARPGAIPCRLANEPGGTCVHYLFPTRFSLPGVGGQCVAIVQVKELIEAGVHFGHRASRWNPKMRPYIYGKRNLIHIIDLRETVRGLLRGHRYLAKTASNGSLILFVGTKRQAKEAIEREATRAGMPFVSERWLGGTLTNYRTIRDRLKRLQELEVMWLPGGENPAKVDLPNYMRGMLNEAGKLDLTKAPDTAPI